jgi:hypothetical protein
MFWVGFHSTPSIDGRVWDACAFVGYAAATLVMLCATVQLWIAWEAFEKWLEALGPHPIASEFRKLPRTRLNQSVLRFTPIIPRPYDFGGANNRPSWFEEVVGLAWLKDLKEIRRVRRKIGPWSGNDRNIATQVLVDINLVLAQLRSLMVYLVVSSVLLLPVLGYPFHAHRPILTVSIVSLLSIVALVSWVVFRMERNAML